MPAAYGRSSSNQPNLEQISKRTGIPRSTINRRWKTRSDLLNARESICRIRA
jgi:hypothetical protein